MPAKRTRSNLLAVAVSGIIAVSGLAACNDTAPKSQPRAFATVSPSPTSSPTATPSPTPVKVVAVPTPKPPTPKTSTKPPTPKTSTKPPAPKPSAHTHSGTVVPGAYCPGSEHGWYGRSAAGNLYRCSYYSTDGRWHWKRV